MLIAQELPLWLLLPMKLPSNAPRRFSSVLVAALAFTSAGSVLADDDAITLKSKVVPNKRYVMQQEVDSEMPLPLGGSGNAKTKMSFVTNMSVKPITDSKNLMVNVDMGDVKMTIDAAGNVMEYDSSDETKQNPLLKGMMGGMLEAKFEAEVDAEGNVIKVTNLGKKTGGLLGGGFGEEELKQLVAAMFDHGFPDKEVKKGESWEHEVETSSGATGSLTLLTKYTYEGSGEQDGKAYPKLAMKGTKAPDKEGAKKGMVDFKAADSEGYMLFDNELGVARFSDTKMTMTMSASGNEMEIDSKVVSKLVSVEDID